MGNEMTEREQAAREVLDITRVADGLAEAPIGVVPNDTAIRAMLAFADRQSPAPEHEGLAERLTGLLAKATPVNALPTLLAALASREAGEGWVTVPTETEMAR